VDDRKLGKEGREMKDFKEIAETKEAYWFKNSAGQLISVPK
jgi:hypothetical protein